MRLRFSTTLVLAIMTVLGLSLALLMSARTALADTNGCPAGAPTNHPTSNLVGAHVTTSGSDATYYFDSFTNESPSGGIPGLIEYCVYPNPLPDGGVTTVAVGDDSTPWVDPGGFDNFSFNRTNGNPSNIGLDGNTHEMGTATWSGGVPAGFDTIVLHINDEAECNRLGQNSQTCFVLPGERGGNEVPPPTVSKDAHGSFDKTFTWTIDKSVDKTTVKQVGGNATFNYTIVVSHDAGTVSNVKVTGTITVNNPNSADVAIDGVTDQLSDGTDCTVTGGGAQSLASGDTTFGYTCSLGSVPQGDVTNTATVSWSEQTLSDGSHLAAGSADTNPVSVSFAENDVDECVNVSDSFAGSLGTVCVGDANPTTFTYPRTIPVPAHDCLSYDNTATFTTNDSGATGSDSQTVTVCGPAQTGALTIGFWKTTNGQGLITSYCQNPALANYLKGLGGGSGPFSNAPTTSCKDLASYVSSILTGASATDMNKMLKAQMLGSALDVWFSGPGWTSTKIGGVKPPSNFLSHNNLGTFNMDTTAVCPMVDNTTAGSATCQNSLPSTDAVASGAVPSSPMSMQAILNFAATTPSPFNGSTASSVWYSGNRTKQEILKNIFDQFNNQLAFGSF